MIINRQTVKDFVEGGKQYIIPQYQRHYSWDKKKWEKLFRDVLDLHQPSGQSKSKLAEHFLGAIVSVPLGQSPSGIARFQVVDGQQRLTTIMLLLCALRDRQSAEEAEITRVELIANFTKKGDDYYRVLHTDKRDRDSFMAITKAENSLEMRSKPKDIISNAYKFFWEKLIVVSDLEKFKNDLTSCLYVVHLQLATENPYVIFESLNAYSEPLTQGDLIRNYFFMHAPMQEHDRLYEEYWLPMEQVLPGHGEKAKPGKPKDYLSEFIRHYLMRNGEVVDLREVYFCLKDQLDKDISAGGINKPDADELTYHLAELKRFAEHYGKLVQPQREQDQQISMSLATLAYLQQTTAYPFLLNVYEAYSRQMLTASKFREILEVLLNFLIRRGVCNTGTQGLNKMFCKLALESKEHNFDIDHLKDFLAKNKYPTDARFKQNLLFNNIYTNGSDRLARVILRALEGSFEHEEQVDLSQSNIEIEHVMPQTLSKWWEDHLGNEFKSIRDECCHLLGNLTLTGKNQTLGNKPFPDKQKELANSHIELNRYFQTINRWTEEEIRERTDCLINTCMTQIWPTFRTQESEDTLTGSRKRGARPSGVTIWTKRIETKTWSALVPAMVEVLLELAPENFDNLLSRFPRYFRREKGNWTQAKRIGNNQAWIKTNWPADQAVEFCEELAELFELDDWSIEYADDHNSAADAELCEQAGQK